LAEYNFGIPHSKSKPSVWKEVRETYGVDPTAPYNAYLLAWFTSMPHKGAYAG